MKALEVFGRPEGVDFEAGMRRDREGGVRQADTMGRGIAHSERTPASARPINAGHLDNLIKFKSSS